MIQKRVTYVSRPLLLASLLSLLINIILITNIYNHSIVVAVPDGDTLQLRDGRRVRLRSIDAPEKDRCMATEAQQLLERIALQRHIRLKEQMTDSYGRILAIAIVEDLPAWIGYMTKSFDPLLNRVMVSRGLARHFNSGSNYDTLLSNESKTAKKSGIGIYSGTCRSSAPHASCTIKGNLRSGVKTYYLPSCDAYDQVIVDEAYGDVWFCSEQEASKEGFIGAKGCRK